MWLQTLQTREHRTWKERGPIIVINVFGLQKLILGPVQYTSDTRLDCQKHRYARQIDTGDQRRQQAQTTISLKAVAHARS